MRNGRTSEGENISRGGEANGVNPSARGAAILSADRVERQLRAPNGRRRSALKMLR